MRSHELQSWGCVERLMFSSMIFLSPSKYLSCSIIGSVSKKREERITFLSEVRKDLFGLRNLKDL